MVAEISERRRRFPPPMPVDVEPYVYNGPVAPRRPVLRFLAGFFIAGTVVVAGVLYAKLGAAQAERDKAATELSNLSASFADQARQLKSMDEARAKLASDIVARDHEAQQAVTKVSALKNAVAAALGDDVQVTSADGRVRVALADKALFDDTDALSDDGKALLAKVARAVPKGDSVVEVVGHADSPRHHRRGRGRDKDDAEPADAWAASAAHAAVVVRALDHRLPARRLVMAGRGNAAPVPGMRNHAVEVVLRP